MFPFKKHKKHKQLKENKKRFRVQTNHSPKSFFFDFARVVQFSSDLS